MFKNFSCAFKLVLLGLFCISSVLFSSCSSDNDIDVPANSADFVGTWEVDSPFWDNFDDDMSDFLYDKVYMRFYNGGKYVSVSIDSAYADDEVEYGEWSIENHKLCVDYVLHDIVKVTKNEIIVTSLGIKFILKRVPDSVIDQYL